MLASLLCFSGAMASEPATPVPLLKKGEAVDWWFVFKFNTASLNKEDLLAVLEALANASVMTDTENDQIVRRGGPAGIKEAVDKLGQKPSSVAFQMVPPCQMVSVRLGGVSLRTATYWNRPKIYSTTRKTKIFCWDKSLDAPGAVEIATTGQWSGKTFGPGGVGGNIHAKLGVFTSGDEHYAIFGDMNQQGSVAAEDNLCKSSQNGRGGLFYVLKSATLAEELTKLMPGETAPTEAP
jgi:hypothetical protein